MQLDTAQENALIEVVWTAAKTEIMPRFRQLSTGAIKEKTSNQDLVTEADIKAELAISAGIRKILPRAVIMGEESLEENPDMLKQIATADMTVIIDPIDGTWNYAMGIAVFGVIVAVTVRGETVFGLLYDPVMDDWILARKGGGCWYHQPGRELKRLQLAQDDRTMAERTALIAPFQFPKPQQAAVANGMLDFHRSYTLRCSCQEYRQLALGVFDFSLIGIERPAVNMNVALNPWDHAAGILVVQEAGGVVEMMDGSAYSPALLEGRTIAAHSRQCLEQVREWYTGLQL